MDGNGNNGNTAAAATTAPDAAAAAATQVMEAPEPLTQLPAEFSGQMPAALALYLNDGLFNRVSTIANRMAKADGMAPRHLLGKPEACFAVVSRAITWRLDPFAVAMATYQTPGGQVGFEGKLIHAILESSGKLEPGGVRFEHYGDWSKVQGKFEQRDSTKTDDNGQKKKYTAATWSDKDAREGKPTDQVKYPMAQSCGVRVTAHIRGEREPRTLDFDLIQAQPRNSTLWATDPMTQICYTAVRRFASACAPALIMGVPFDAMDNAEPMEVSGERVDQRPAKGPVQQPQSKSAPAKGKTYDNDGGFTTSPEEQARNEAKQKEKVAAEKAAHAAHHPQQQPAAAAQQQSGDLAGDGAGVAASPGMIKHIRALLEKNTLSDAEMEKCVGVKTLDGIDVAKANEVLKWIANPVEYARP